MANPEHVAIVKQGKEAIDTWREQHPSQRLELAQADLSRADLSRANLGEANLSR